MSSWQIKKLGEILDKVVGGGTPSKEKSSYWNGAIPWASVKDLTNFSDYKTQDYITEEGLANSSSRLIEAGTLITPTRMALGFTVQFGVDVAINQDLKAIYPNSSVDKNYLKYWFESNRGRIERLGVGSTVAGIQVNELKSIKVHLPEKMEQKRIVAVLEVWDEYLELLDQKIALKERLKKGLMQQLLTGKKRLPGFTDSWSTMVFHDVFKVISKFPGYKSGEYQQKGKYPIYDQSYDKHVSGYIDEPTKIIDAKTPYVLFGDHSRVVKYVDSEQFAVGNDGIKLLQARKSADDYFAYLLLKCHRVPNTGYNRHFKYITDAAFEIPELKEQAAIAKVIQVSDKEVDLLRLKLSKASLQKKYLLKNLISGTIRTPENLHIKGIN